MDHQVSPEPQNGQSEEEEESSDLENGPKEEAVNSSSSPSKLFAFSVVNSYGTANITPLPCEGNVLKLNRQYFFFFYPLYLISLFAFITINFFKLFPSLQHIPRWPSTGT